MPHSILFIYKDILVGSLISILRMFDAVIVGAGVAGLSCAIRAAEHGANVLVLDKKEVIGFPIRSTGGIAEYWVRKLGLDIGKIANYTHRVEDVYLVSPSGHRYRFRGADLLPNLGVGYVVDHGMLEAYLAEEAARRDVTIMKGFRVDSLSKLRNMFSSRFYIGADGPYSTVRRSLGIPINDGADMAKGIEFWLPRTLLVGGDDGIYVHFNEVAKGGYSWWFTYRNIVKVGLGVPLTVTENTEQLLHRYLEKYLLQSKVAYSWGGRKSLEYVLRNVSGKVGGVIPVPPPLKRVVYGDVALLGDAGNIINSAVGGGIATSIFSGQMCGDAVAEGKLEKYQSSYRRRLYPFLKRWYKMKKLLYERFTAEDLDKFVKILSDGPYVPKSINPLRALSGALWHVGRRDIRLLFKIMGALLW